MAEREGAVVKRGHDEGLERAISLLQRFELPRGLLPLANVVETGFVERTGFMWISQQERVVRQQVSCDPEVEGYIEKGKIWGLRGVEAKVLTPSRLVSEITADWTARKIWFKSHAGIPESLSIDIFDAGQ